MGGIVYVRVSSRSSLFSLFLIGVLAAARSVTRVVYRARYFSSRAYVVGRPNGVRPGEVLHLFELRCAHSSKTRVACLMTALGSYRCLDCVGGCLYCDTCLVRMHSMTPFHRVQVHLQVGYRGFRYIDAFYRNGREHFSRKAASRRPVRASSLATTPATRVRTRTSGRSRSFIQMASTLSTYHFVVVAWPVTTATTPNNLCGAACSPPLQRIRRLRQLSFSLNLLSFSVSSRSFPCTTTTSLSNL